MYKDSEEEIKIIKKHRTYYCNCCGKKIIEAEESPVVKGQFDIFCTLDDPRKAIRIEPDDRAPLKLSGDFCYDCWNKLNADVIIFFSELCKEYSKNKEKMDVQNKSDQKS